MEQMSPSGTPTRVSIKEANDHLRLLHNRVSELETAILAKNQQYAQQEISFTAQLKDLKAAKETQIEQLTKTIIDLENKIKDLELEVKIKSDKLEEGQSRLALLDALIPVSLPFLENMICQFRRMAIDGNESSGIGLLSESSVSESSNPEFKEEKDEKQSLNGYPKDAQDRRKEGSLEDVKRSIEEEIQILNEKKCLEDGRRSIRRKPRKNHNENENMSPQIKYLGQHKQFKGKMGRIFSITSNFSEDEEIPSRFNESKNSHFDRD